MQLRFWGTRGSLPVSGPSTLRYGGNTSCVSVEVPGEPLLVVDAGTGIASLARSLGRPSGFRCTLLLGHLHWDHLIGLPFFFSADAPGAEVDVYGPAGDGGLRAGIDAVMCPPGFPIGTGELAGTWRFHDLHDETVALGSITVTARHLRHRGPTLGFRIEAGSAVVAYLSDHGPGAEHRGPEHDELVPDSVLDLVEGADLLVHDSQYTDEEYAERRHYGHCTPGYAVKVAAAGRVGTLALFHHDPGRDDDGVEAMLSLAARAARDEGYKGEVVAAAEGACHTIGEDSP